LEIKVITTDSDPRIIITNKGINTIPFSRDGFRSIMRADLSSKQLVTGSFTEGETIGNKGLGFRAVLNWSSHIEIDSAGLHCDFDEKTAWSKWAEIKSKLENDGCDDLLKNCLAVAKDKCPISLLATPEVKTANTEPKSTSITIHFDQTHEDNIISQINDLRPNILFFVRNIKQISIIVNDDSPRIMNRSEWEEKKRISPDVYISSCILSDSDSQNTWLKYNFQDEDSEIAIAWREDGYPVKKEERFFYSFFPTKVFLNLPCIVHANVDLDAARNRILPSDDNKNTMQTVGQCLVKLAEYIAECDEAIGVCDWRPYKMLCFSQDGLQEPLNCLIAGIEETLSNAEIFPTVKGKYKTLDKVCCYCEELAVFLKNHTDFDYFENHLLLGWDAEFVSKCRGNIYTFAKTISYLVADICTLAQTDEQSALKIYSEIINVIMQVKKGNYLLKVDFLPDCNWNIITANTAYVNCGQFLRNAPDFLNIRYVHPKLVDFCCSEDSAYKFRDNRDMVRKLKDICDISASDISQMKDRIISFSKDEQYKNSELFKRIIKCLYETFSEIVNTTNFSEYMGYDFFVLAGDGKQYPVNEVTLWDESRTIGLSSLLSEKQNISERWQLYGTIQFWCNYLQCSENDVVDFFHNFIGVSLGLPLLYVNCGEDREYIQEGIKGTNLNVLDFTKARLGEYYSPYNNCFIVCPDIIPELIDASNKISALLQFVKIIFGDKKCYDLLISPQTASYFQKTCKTQRFESSYMSYMLRSNPLLNALKYYAIEEDFSADGTQLGNSVLLNNIPDEQRRILLSKLGAARRLHNIPIENLYEMLASFPGGRGTQKFYQKVRDALRYHIDSANSTEEKNTIEARCSELAAEKLDKLIAHKGHSTPELVNRNMIYYWDNDILAKQLLDKLYKLEIGSRVGAESVVKLFGIKRLEHESISVNLQIINQELTLAVQELLLTRRPYILAKRMQTLDENKISEVVTLLKNLDVKIVSDCKYDFYGESYSMNPGELIQDESNRFIICTAQRDLSSALKKPEFCMALGEMLCILFKLTGSSIAGQFRDVLKNSIEEIDYYREREISHAEWERILAALGLSDEECSLWQNILQRPLTDEEKDLLSSEKTRLQCIANLTQKTNETLACCNKVLKDMSYEQVYDFLRWLDVKNFQCGEFVKAQLYKFFICELRHLTEKFLDSFAFILHEQIEKKCIVKQYDYCKILQDYTQNNDEWLAPYAKILAESFPLADKEKINSYFIKVVKEKYDISLSLLKVNAPNFLSHYYSILNEAGVKGNELDADVRSLLFFEGNTDVLRDKLIHKSLMEERTESDIDFPSTTGIFDNVVFEVIDRPTVQENRTESSHQKNLRKSRKNQKKGIRYASSQELQAKGTKAELLVVREMKKRSNQFVNIKIWSSLSATQGYADDSRHYDISYETSNGEVRYLEIKATEDNSFIMSNLEYETAKSEDFRDKYDLALVDIHAGIVRFYIAPFSNNSFFQGHIRISPESWHIALE